ncbi:MAG: hypothetical protein ACKPKO_50145, partial [Candidatus Fonsibacter sp.]
AGPLRLISASSLSTVRLRSALRQRQKSAPRKRAMSGAQEESPEGLELKTATTWIRRLEPGKGGKRVSS